MPQNINLGGSFNQNQGKNVGSTLSTNREGAAIGGRGLGGVGGSIISSSGMNQNFKDYSSGAVKGAVGATNGMGSTLGLTNQTISNKEQRLLESNQ